VETILEHIKRGHWWKFNGGIQPPEQKFYTNDKPIRNLPMPEELILPLKQHIGQMGELLVNIGDKVLKGQALTQSHHAMAVPIHAPTSGTVTSIKSALIAHPSGLSEDCLFLKPDGEDKWKKRQVCSDYRQLSRHEIITKIANAGIAGMGGAGFPTHIKVATKLKIKFLIINAAECEPYITADDLLMREHGSAIVDGIQILAHLLKPEQVLIGIEDNKPEAIKALKQATAQLDNFTVCVVPTMYPTGGEKQLIKILTGQEVPQSALPSSLGIVMQNVATCFAIADAVFNDVPLIKRVVTVTGQALQKPQNVWALLGTPISHLLTCCGYQAQQQEHLIMGGPMMGFSLPNSNIGIIKTSNCILAPSNQEISNENNEVECIRCGRCADVCPSQLLPQELQWHAKAKDQTQLKKFNLFDCIECGACAYVCPSQIPLVHYYRVAKAEIKQQQLQDKKAEQAKRRFEARKIRLEQEKLKREEKHRQAAEARRALMNDNSNSSQNAKSTVAAALARVKARKAKTEQAQPGEAQPQTSDKKSQVAIAIARAKTKKAQQIELDLTQNESSNVNKNSADKSIIDEKKKRIAVAIAKAKAKKSSASQSTQQKEST